MANVRFAFDYWFEAPPEVVWDALIDWKGHENWVPSTWVELHTVNDGHGEPMRDPTAVGAEFTAWTGVAPGTGVGKKLSLEDRMAVAHIEFNPRSSTGSCRVDKIGPVLAGHASFTVEPDGAYRTKLRWTEEVVVPYAPQLLAPILAKIATAGFRFGFGRLRRQLG